jgi:hypothetical protein
MQTGGTLPVPGAVCTVPAGQAPAGRQLDWLTCVVSVPAGQLMHTRSDVGEPAVLTYVPGWQLDHGVHWAVVFDAGENWPLGHGPQTSSAVELPAWVTYWPAGHGVQPEQVMELIVTLNVPESQGLHVWSVVDEPRVAICSPGVHTVQAWHWDAALFQKLPVAHSVGPPSGEPPVPPVDPVVVALPPVPFPL